MLWVVPVYLWPVKCHVLSDLSLPGERASQIAISSFCLLFHFSARYFTFLPTRQLTNRDLRNNAKHVIIAFILSLKYIVFSFGLFYDFAQILLINLTKIRFISQFWHLFDLFFHCPVVSSTQYRMPNSFYC